MLKTIPSFFKRSMCCLRIHYKKYAVHHGSFLQGIGTTMAGFAAIFAISKAPAISEKIESLAVSVASASRISEATNATIARLDKAEEVIRISLAELSKARLALGLASIGQSTKKIPSISASNDEIKRFYMSQIKPLIPDGTGLDDKSLNDIIRQWPSLKDSQDRLYLFEEALKER